jgi:exopolysaccharide biosynthesis polyprenyl glycosylphosphotransferase
MTVVTRAVPDERPASRLAAPFSKHSAEISGISHGSRFIPWTMRMLDTVAFMAAFLLLWSLRTGDWGLQPLSDPRLWGMWGALIGSLYLSDCYRLDPHLPGWNLPLRAIAVTLLAGLMVGLGVYLAGPMATSGGHSVLSRSVMVPSFIGLALVVGVIRWVLQRRQRRHAQSIRWLVLGATGSEALAHLNDTWEKQRSPGHLTILVSDASQQERFPIAGNWAEMDRFLELPWSGVILTGGWDMPDEVIERLMMARLSGLRIYDLGDFYERFLNKVPVYHLHHGWLAMAGGFALLHDPLSVRLKRICDIVVVLALLVLAAPAMVAAYLGVRMTSPGPGLFTQPRVGLGGKVFTCYKFRSMRIGSEGGNKYTVTGDRRITAIGRFLRKSRLDELPQLWNILKGDMSFIGPRAEWTKCVADYEHVIPFYHLRHLVRPGLTGWAQVNYPYGASIDDAREKLEYDLFYLKNQSLWLDVIILLRTIRVVLWGKGAR